MVNIEEFFSRVIGTGTAMSIRLVVQVRAEGIAIVLSISGPSIEFIVEALPLFISAVMVAELIRLVRPRDTLSHIRKFHKVVADDSLYFTAIDQVEELWLDASIEVSLDKGGLIAINLYMGEVRELDS